MVTEKGLSVIEIIFSIGVTVLVITGVVSLIVQSTGVKTNALQREKATVVAQKVIEDLVYKKNNDRENFWNLTPILSETLDEYTYMVEYTQIDTGDCSNPPSLATCANALITVGWGNSQTLVVQRFFSNNY